MALPALRGQLGSRSRGGRQLNGRPQQPHLIRPNADSKTPHLVLVVDTEATWHEETRREIQILRLWAARVLRRHGRDPKRPEREDFDGTTADELVQLAESLATKDRPLWLFTHNLNYDLTLTRLPLHLLARGWALSMHNLASTEPWAIFRRGRSTIRLADSHSWLPVPVLTLGEKLGLPKVDLPENDDSPEAWRERCRGDVDITARAVGQLLDTWDRLELGHFAVTGPGSGWNAMRHMWTKHPRVGPEDLPADTERAITLRVRGLPLVDPDPEARAFERQAIYGGRRELWRWGPQPPEQYVELDLKTAHLAVCAHFPVPERRLNRFESLQGTDWRVSSRHLGLLGSCLVRTEIPRYPMRTRHGVLHPVGTFRTTLAGPELREALRRGELLQVGPVWTYALGSYMQPWARWALDVLHAPGGDADQLLQVMVKGWSRTVPGRWGMMIAREGLSGESPYTGWRAEPAAFGWPPKPGWLVWLGGRWTELVRDQEADNSFPAVLAYVQSWVRLLLGRLLDRLGPGAVLQVNTDSLLVRWDRLAALRSTHESIPEPEHNPYGPLDSALRELETLLGPLRLGVKGISPELRLLSPQHLEFAGERRFSGVPKTATETGRDRFEFHTWPGLRGQMERGDPRGYVRELRTVDLSGITPARWAYEDGCCEPPRIAQDGRNGSRPVRVPPAQLCEHGARLRARQHSALTQG